MNIQPGLAGVLTDETVVANYKALVCICLRKDGEIDLFLDDQADRLTHLTAIDAAEKAIRRNEP